MSRSQEKKFKVNQLYGYLCLLGVVAPSLSLAANISIPNYDPELDDENARGNTIVISGGANDTVTSTNVSNTFISGNNPTPTQESLRDLVLTDPNNILNEMTLSLGSQNLAISVPDPITGASITMSVYNSSNIILDTTLIGDRQVNVYDNVNNMQYIDIAIAKIDSTGGTMSVSLGATGAGVSQIASTNSLSLAAKQTTLFSADGENNDAIINWDTNNRVNFFGAYVDPSATSTYNAQGIPDFAGSFTFTSLAGAQYSATVIDEASLKAYNNMLISELEAGRLLPEEYNSLFALAFTLRSGSATYQQAATPPDEIFEPIGDRIIIHSKGSKAAVNINAKLEGSNATTAVQLEDGAKLVISNTGSLGNTNGSTVAMSGTSSTTNNGVININFVTDAAGSRTGGGNDNVQGILVNEQTSFTNNSIMNIETNGGTGNTIGIVINSSDAAAAGTGYQAVAGGYYSAGNNTSGIINVGVSSKSSSGATIGVLVDSAESSFINEGLIYLGRTNQNTNIDPTTDTNVNQKNYLSGIVVQNDGTGINVSDIVFGTGVQNGVGMYANSGDNITMKNIGNITLQDNGGANVPNTNYAMLVKNAGGNGNGGATGNIVHSGTITLGGVNGIGLKVISTGNNYASASTAVGSLIDINGAINVGNTRNYGVWVEGQGNQTATADLDGEIKLEGDGAIGIHARGNASVDVSDNSIPQFINGEKQIGFFAYGKGAQITLTGGTSVFDVSTDKSTMFRIENGADLVYLGANLQITTSGAESVGINGTGIGAFLDLRGATFNVDGLGATGAIVEGGAAAQIINGTEFNLGNNDTIAILLDGNKHDLKNDVLETMGAHMNADTLMLSNGNSNVTGFIVKNGSDLFIRDRNEIKFLGGTGNTGVSIFSGGNVENRGSIDIDDGTGIFVDGQGSIVQNAGAVHIADGAGMFITNNGAATGLGNLVVDDGDAGVHLSNGGILSVTQGAHSIIANGSAHGIWLDTGTTGILVANTSIDILGSGHGIENTAETSTVTLRDMTINVTNGAGIRTAVSIDPNSKATVNVAGGGIGFDFINADLTTETAGDLMLGTDYTFNVNGAGGTGIQAMTTGSVQTSSTVHVNSANGGAALKSGRASSTVNQGTLTSKSTVAPVVDLTDSLTGTSFANHGTITALDHTYPAVQGSAFADQIYITDGSITGDVRSGNGDDLIVFGGGLLNGSITMGTGKNLAAVIGADLSTTYHITSLPTSAGGSGKSELELRGVHHRGGTFAADNLGKGVNLGEGWNQIVLRDDSSFVLTDNIVLDTGNQAATLTIQPRSVLYAGNGVHSVISGTTSQDLTLNNFGTIDLTNGTSGATDTLTVQGNYAAASILALDTVLDDGGRLINQHTDRLLITGNVTGSTTVYVNPTSVLGKGDGTDQNGDKQIQSNEGISIIQVAGTSTADAFVLKNGYVAAGAFAYELYSFAPGESNANQRVVSGSGNQFWDYRLANGVVGPRYKLIPQASAYFSLPTGIGHYDYMLIDDLHKRLGELRYQGDNVLNGQDEAKRSELFIRAIGLHYDYKTDLSFSDYGYNFKFKAEAIQLGVNLLNVVNNEKNNFQVGVAWTHGNSRITPDTLEGFSKTKTRSDMLGLYATWQNHKGFYLDGVLALSRHKTDIETYVSTMNKLKSKGWIASIEGGYRHMFSNGWIVEPQAQLTYIHTKFDDSLDKDNVFVHYDHYNQTTLRVGVRTTRTWLSKNGLQFKPYARVNYYHGFGRDPKVTLTSNSIGAIGTKFEGGKFGNAVQAGIGLTFETATNLMFYGEIDYQKEVGGSGMKGVRGNVGLRWEFH